MRFTDVSPGLANALEKLGGDAESIVSAASSAAASVADGAADAAPMPTVGVDDLVSLFTTADEAEAQRNNAEDENVSRFLKGGDDERAPRRPNPPRARARPKPRKKDKEQQTPVTQRRVLAQQKKATSARTTETTTTPELSPELPEAEARPTDDPHAMTQQRERAPAKRAARRAKDVPAEEQPATKPNTTNGKKEASRGALERAARQEQTLRQHFESSQLKMLHKKGQRAAQRAERRRAEQKAAAHKAAAQNEAKPRETQQQDRERALAWTEGFEALENLHAKGGHGWADFLFGSEAVEEDRLGLNEADHLSDGLRCKGRVEDGSRCLRRPPEGEMYCREHRTTI